MEALTHFHKFPDLPRDVQGHLLAKVDDPKDQVAFGSTCRTARQWYLDATPDVWEKRFLIANPKLAKAVSQIGDYGKLYYESYRHAALKPDKWKWKCYDAFEGITALACLSFMILGMAESMKLLEGKRTMFCNRLWRHWPDRWDISHAAYATLATSLLLPLVVLSKLKNNWRRDPYEDCTTKIISSTTSYVFPDCYARQKMLYFNFARFRDDPHYAVRLAYHNQIDPTTFATIRVLTAAIEDWIAAIANPQEADLVKEMFTITGEAGLRSRLQQLPKPICNGYKSMVVCYRKALRRDKRNSCFLIDPEIWNFLYPPADVGGQYYPTGI